MGPNTKLLTKKDRAFIFTPFDSSRKTKAIENKESQNQIKNELCPITFRLKSGIFWALSWLFWPHFLRYRLQICFALHLQ